MKVLIVGIIVLALAVAGVSTYLIQSFSGEENIEELQKEAQKPKLTVLVASKKLWPGTKVGPDSMVWQAWVEGSLNDQYIVAEGEDQQEKRMRDFSGGIVRQVISQGEPILATKVFKRDKPGFLAGALDPGMRAVAVKVSPTTGAAGFILPGDRVDVLLTHDKAKEVVRKRQREIKDPDAPLTVISHTTETILRGLRVLAVDNIIGEVEGQAVPTAKTVTLEVTPKQAESLTTAQVMGKLSMVLRSISRDDEESDRPSFTTDVEVSPLISNINTVLEGKRDIRATSMKKRIEALESELKEERERKAAPSPRSTKTAKEKQVIKIYRGGKAGLEEVTVKK